MLVVALISDLLRGLRHCKKKRQEQHRVVPSFVLLDLLFVDVQTPFPAPLESLQRHLLALEFLPFVLSLRLLLSSGMASFPSQ